MTKDELAAIFEITVSGPHGIDIDCKKGHHRVCRFAAGEQQPEGLLVCWECGGPMAIGGLWPLDEEHAAGLPCPACAVGVPRTSVRGWSHPDGRGHRHLEHRTLVAELRERLAWWWTVWPVRARVRRWVHVVRHPRILGEMLGLVRRCLCCRALLLVPRKVSCAACSAGLCQACAPQPGEI